MEPTTSAALERYKRATARWMAAEADSLAASNARAIAVLELCESGNSMREVGNMLGMTSTRVHELCVRARKMRETR
jgi:DNA-binding NarL/FixJ family response regulator